MAGLLAQIVARVRRRATQAPPPPVIGRDDDAEGCLAHLIGARVYNRFDLPTPIGNLIEVAISHRPGGSAELLRQNGLIVTAPVDAPASLMVASWHPAIAVIYLGTAWTGERWSHALYRLDDARVSPTQLRFGDISSRAVEIPMRHFWTARRRLAGAA